MTSAPHIVTTLKEIAEWAQISDRTLDEWRDAGFPTRLLRGQYVLIVDEGITWIRENAPIVSRGKYKANNGQTSGKLLRGRKPVR